MKIAILGSGGREHAIAMQIAKSHNLDELYCIPGNAGTNSINEVAKVYNFNLDIKYNVIFQKQRGKKFAFMKLWHDFL